MLNSKNLAERIESAQVTNQNDYANAHAALNRSGDCLFMQLGKTGALYAGADSPLTQSFGLGFGEESERPDLYESVFSRLEEFFFSYNVPVNIELANLTPLDLTIFLGQRGYTVCEYSHVLGYDLSVFDNKTSQSATLQAHPTNLEELPSLAETIAAGFLEHNVGEKEIAQEFLDLFTVSMQTAGSTAFTVKIDGEIAGAGGLTLINGVAMLSGASTQPKFRNRGVQKALIDARLLYARDAGCDIAVVSTAPGTISQENMQKYGFQILYARTKFTLPSKKA